ncbi:MAG: YncE family protein [SAR324 cluster bacterium]|nr:YncE family protein [SAR324 cluster bacterium]
MIRISLNWICCMLSASIFFLFAANFLKAGTLFITNQGSGDLTVFDDAAFKVQSLIPIGPQPWGGAVTPDRKTGCVSYRGGLAILDFTKREVVRHVMLEGQGMGVAISPNGKTCYVAVNGYGDDRLLAINQRTGGVEGEVLINARAFGVYISPDSRRLYVPEHGGSSLSVIDTSTFSLFRRIPLNPYGENSYARAHYLAMSSDGRALYLPFEGRVLMEIETGTLTESIHPLDIHAHQHGLAISPDGRKIYLANNVLGGDGSLSEIDRSTMKELRRFPLDRHHEQVLVDSEGRHVYLTGGFVMGHRAHNKLTVVNLKNGKAIYLETGGELPFALFRSP